MGIAIAQWLESSSWSPRVHERSHLMRDPLLLFGGMIIITAFLWPVLFLGFLFVFYGSRILT